MEAVDLRIVVECWKHRSILIVDSPGRGEYGVASWSEDPRRTPEIFLTISGVPSEPVKWALLVSDLEIPMETFGITLQFFYGHPSEFSVDDLTFWNPTTQIEFHPRYSDILSALHHLSKPIVKDGVSTWPFPRVKSIILQYETSQRDQDWSVPGITHAALQSEIRNILRAGSMQFDAVHGTNSDGERPVPVEVTIKASLAHIEKFRGYVADGVQLVVL